MQPPTSVGVGCIGGPICLRTTEWQEGSTFNTYWPLELNYGMDDLSHCSGISGCDLKNLKTPVAPASHLIGDSMYFMLEVCCAGASGALNCWLVPWFLALGRSVSGKPLHDSCSVTPAGITLLVISSTSIGCWANGLPLFVANHHELGVCLRWLSFSSCLLMSASVCLGRHLGDYSTEAWAGFCVAWAGLYIYIYIYIYIYWLWLWLHRCISTPCTPSNNALMFVLLCLLSGSACNLCALSLYFRGCRMLQTNHVLCFPL